MFWHESQENDINIFPYNKSDFLKLSSAQSYKEKEKNSNNMIDLSDDFKIDTIVSTDWGPGKVVSVNKAEKKVRVKIEGEEKEFSMHELLTNNQVILHIYFKGLDLQDKKIFYLSSITAGETVLDMKKKIAKILGTSDSCVTLVYNGYKMTNNNQRFSEVGFYNQDILVVVNGICDY